MLRKLLNRLFGPFSSGGVIPLGEFLILLQKSYAYLRKHRYRVLSTELPDDLLKKWLMPMPGEKQAEEYKRSFARQNDTCLSRLISGWFWFSCFAKHTSRNSHW